MAVIDRYASGYQDPAVKPADPLPVETVRGTMKALVSTVEITNGDSAASKQYFGKVPSNARLSKLSRLDHDAITGTTDYDLGGVNDPDALIDGADIALAGNKDAVGIVNIVNLHKPLWVLLGYTTDPGGELAIFGTVKVAATATGTVTLTLIFYLP